MKSPKKGRAPKLTLADLGSVMCMVCEQQKPASGAAMFHSMHVCAECRTKGAQRSNNQRGKEPANAR